MELPRVVWISGLIYPKLFLAAICQVSAQKSGGLDTMLLQTEVLTVMKEDFDCPSPDGFYIHGLSLQGARCAAAGQPGSSRGPSA